MTRRSRTSDSSQRGDASGGLAPVADLRLAQVAEREQQIVERRRHGATRRPSSRWSDALEALDRLGVEELAQLRLAEELAQLRLVDRERLGPPLGERRVAVVDEVGDVGEQERRGERRGDAGVDA